LHKSIEYNPEIIQSTDIETSSGWSVKSLNRRNIAVLSQGEWDLGEKTHPMLEQCRADFEVRMGDDGRFRLSGCQYESGV